MMELSDHFVPSADKQPVKVILVLKDGSEHEFNDFIVLVGEDCDTKCAYATQISIQIPKDQPAKVMAFLSSMSVLTYNFLKVVGVKLPIRGESPEGNSDESPT